MTQEQVTPTGTAFSTIALTFLAGAAVGAIVVALTTPKSGNELRGDLKDFGVRMRRKASDLMNKDEVPVDLGV